MGKKLFCALLSRIPGRSKHEGRSECCRGRLSLFVHPPCRTPSHHKHLAPALSQESVDVFACRLYERSMPFQTACCQQVQATCGTLTQMQMSIEMPALLFIRLLHPSDSAAKGQTNENAILNVNFDLLP